MRSEAITDCKLVGQPGHDECAYRRLFASSWPNLASRGGAQISYSAAAVRQLAPHAGVISPHFLLPLGYEHHDVHLHGATPACTSR
jgi:hypothetical protein